MTEPGAADKTAPGRGPVAFVDESFREHPAAGFYVLAAVVVWPGARGGVDEAMHGLLRGFRGAKSRAKLHWNELEPHQQRRAARRVAGLDADFLATVGAPVPPRRQERARVLCLQRLVTELHARKVTRMVVEARQPELNQRDIRTVTGTRFTLPRGAPLRIEHTSGHDEPALWVADLIAGATRAHRLSQPAGRILADRVHRLAIDC